MANFVNAADRVIMPIAIVELAKVHRYNLHQQGWILSAFPAGYISSQIVGSCAGAQFGGRRLLLFVVFMWSLSTILTPMVASNFHLLVLTRIVLGLGEGLGLPTIYHLFAESVSTEQRSKAFSYLAAFGAIGQTIAAAACPHFDWRFGFYLFGGFGFVWCLVWMKYYEDPGPSLPEQSLLCIKAPNPFREWRIFFASRPLCSIYVAHFCMNWTAYVVMHWLPTYLHTTMKANPTDLSLACLPYILNSLCSIGVGHLADNLVNRHRLSLVGVRKLCTVIGLVGPALLLFMVATVSHLYSAVILISLSMGLLAFNSAGHLSNHADLCPKFAGITFAISNTIATLPGLVVGPLTAEFVVESSGRWWPVYVLAGMLNLVGAVIYAGHASTKQLA